MKNPLSYPARFIAYAVAIAVIPAVSLGLWPTVALTIAAGVGIELLMGYLRLN